MDPVEQAFAAAVANARGEAKILATAGCFPTNACDQVAGALAVLWKDGTASGHVRRRYPGDRQPVG